MQTMTTEKYFLFILLLLTIILTLLILSPFLAVLLLTVSFSVALNPVYLWIKKRVTFGVSWLASILTIIIFLACLCTPLFFVGKTVFYQAQDIYVGLINSEHTGSWFDSINTTINHYLPDGFNFDLQDKLSGLFSSLTSGLGKLFSSTLNSVLMFTLMLFALFYLFKDGEKWEKSFIKILPLSDENATQIVGDLKSSINRIFKGSFIIAIAQGLLAWLGFTVFGVPHAAIWAIVAGIASFIPTIGTSIVSIPAMAFLFFTGMHLQALGLLLWSMLLIGTIDNILNPYIISKNTEIPSLFMLFSILGGVALIGAIGIIVGPLTLSLLYSLVSIYKKGMTDSKN
ncbi:MAG: AI-2E family transporter [Candidatus Moranbacteria bacterium]|nr:AI-2E family transporter [Candidatus Moranbacteria bacterium]